MFSRPTAGQSSKWEESELAQQAKWDAGLYDDKHSFVYKMAEGLLELLAAQPGEKILDIGCGTGHLTGKIASAGALVTGVDRSPDMIRQAREAYPALQFEVANAIKIPLQGPFDAIFSNATLHWIKEPEMVIAEVSRLLRPGGRFVAEFGGHGNVALVGDALHQAWAISHLPGSLPNPWYYPRLGEYASLLEKHGLEVTYGLLFERPTPLEEGENGLRNWLTMFGGAIFTTLTEHERDQMIAETVRQARPGLFHDGRWVLDYRRLRVVAKKQ
jgi:trans-aconitate methyltransferase